MLAKASSFTDFEQFICRNVTMLLDYRHHNHPMCPYCLYADIPTTEQTTETHTFLYMWCVKLALSIKTYSMCKTSPVTSHLHIDQGAELIWQSVCTHTPSCVGTPLHWSVYWSGIIICPWDTSDVPLATFWSLDLCSTPLLSSQDNPSLLVNTTSATRGDSELLKPHSI